MLAVLAIYYTLFLLFFEGERWLEPFLGPGAAGLR